MKKVKRVGVKRLPPRNAIEYLSSSRKGKDLYFHLKTGKTIEVPDEAAEQLCYFYSIELVVEEEKPSAKKSPTKEVSFELDLKEKNDDETE